MRLGSSPLLSEGRTVEWCTLRVFCGEHGKGCSCFLFDRVLYFVFATGVGRDGVVGIATRCGLNDLGIESRWVREFPHPSVSALGPTQPPVRWVTGLLSVVKLTGRGVGHPPPPLPPRLTLIPPTWKIWWANNANKWRLGFKSTLKGLRVPLLPLSAFVACCRVNFTFVEGLWCLTL